MPDSIVASIVASCLPPVFPPQNPRHDARWSAGPGSKPQSEPSAARSIAVGEAANQIGTSYPRQIAIRDQRMTGQSRLAGVPALWCRKKKEDAGEGRTVWVKGEKNKRGRESNVTAYCEVSIAGHEANARQIGNANIGRPQRHNCRPASRLHPGPAIPPFRRKARAGRHHGAAYDPDFLRPEKTGPSTRQAGSARSRLR
ncbi:hypothetical protein WOLCODRAFT_163454 [Wolfiporia cocos MD-104 SS10]|uniref:Uncharacterized protein n=1 Tax=Wolfiporia cocos (strain MD-104) TaxID=742152 RepID=A0A2H3K0Q3_WOLCO|nr:hypothetical protein WOLCODRAFT_163454 [Wolfiporia cocos MD-104 SS10]